MPRSAVALARLAAPTPGAPDAQLLHRFNASQGDDAFAELVRRHGPMVLAVCKRVLSDAHDAEDAFQAVFIVLARKAGAIRGTNLAGWLYGVAIRTARSVRLTRERRRKRERVASANGERQTAEEAAAADHDTARIIDQELAKLAEHYRDAIVMCELRGLSRKEAAAELRIPEGTLSSRLAAAKKKLAELLSARGVTGAAVLTASLAPAALPAALLESTALAVRGAAGGAATAAASTVLKGMLFDQLRTSILATAVLVAGVCGGLAMTGVPDAPPAKAVAPAPRPVEDPAVKLVQQLGSEDFAEREAAQKALRELGAKADPALRAGLRSDDPEVRTRSAQVLKQIRDAERQAFLAGKVEPTGPTWKRFKELLGNTDASRKLFVEMMADDKRAAAIERAEANPDKAAEVYAAEVARVSELNRKSFEQFIGQPAPVPGGGQPNPIAVASRKAVVLGDVVAVLFLGTHPLPNGAKDPSASLVLQASFADGTGGPLKEPLRKLFVAWIDQRRDPATVRDALESALFAGLPEILPTARRLAADTKLPAKAKGLALLALGNYGTLDDLPTLAAHAADDRAYRDYTTIDKKRYEIQVRDAATAMSLHLRGQDYEKYGFERTDWIVWWVPTEPAPLKDVHWFETDKDRDAAHKKAWEWLDKQPKPEPKKGAPKKEEPKKEEPTAAKLVEQLASADFAEREAAEKALKELGSKARGAIEAGLKSESPEVVKRCRELLEHLARAEFDARHWARFAKTIGDDKGSRALFERIRSQPRNIQLLDAVAADSKAAEKLYHDRWAELNKAARVPTGVGSYQLVAAPLADVVGWMYLGTFPGAESSFHQSRSLDFLPGGRNPGDAITKALKDDTIAVPLRKLLGVWTAARIDYNGLVFGFQLALDFDIKEVLPAARAAVVAKVKDDPYPGNTARGIACAMLVIGKLGSKDDLPLLERRAADDAHCATVLNDPEPEPGQPQIWLLRPPKEGQDATGQLRDVSAAMRLHLLGENPDAFGFYWQRPGKTERKPVKLDERFDLYQIGFLRDTDRTAAHKKAQEWFDKQKK